MGPRAPIGAKAGCLHVNGYNNIKIDGIKYRASLLAWLYMTGEWPIGIVDHENRERNDDRWENLRSATILQNIANSGVRKDNRCGTKGVSITKHRSKPFRSRITIYGKRILLGDFATLDEASRVYADASRKQFGEFSCV